MIVTGHECNVHLKQNTRLAFDDRLRTGTRRKSEGDKPNGVGNTLHPESRRAKSCLAAPSFTKRGRAGVLAGVLAAPFHNRQRSCTAILQSADEAFADRDADGLANLALAMTNATSLAPGSERRAGELRAGIGDKVFGCGTSRGDDSAKKLADLLRSGLLFENSEAEHSTRIVIDDDGKPPTEGPALWQRERKPRCPHPGVSRHDRQIRMPNMVRSVGGHAPCGRHGSDGRRRLADSWFAANATDGRGCQRCRPARATICAILTLPSREKRVCKCCTMSRTKSGYLLTGWGWIAERSAHLHQGAFPTKNVRLANLEDSRGLRQRPSTSGAQFEDGEPLVRLVVPPTCGGNSSHAHILDAEFLAQRGNLLTNNPVGRFWR